MYFPNRKVCWFLFQELVVSWFPLLSICSTAGPLVLTEASELSCSLWPPGTESMPVLLVLWVIWDRNQFLRQPSEKLEYLMHIPLFSFFPQGRSHSWALSPNSELCQFLFAILQVLWCCHKLLSSFLFSAVPRHPKYAVPHQCSESSETETTPLGRALICRPLFYFPPKGDATSWAFPLNCGQCHVEGKDWHGWNEMTCFICFSAAVLGFKLAGVLWLSNWILEFL